jgi:hypothetical protein
MPGTAIGSVAVAIAPVPFLFIYATLFLLRGTILPVSPPDITSTRGGEALSGLVALAYLVVIVLGVYFFLSQRGRWVFLVGQLVCFGICVDFVLDPSSGDPGVPLLLGATSALAVVLACLTPSWEWISGPRAAGAGIQGPELEQLGAVEPSEA